MAVFIVLSFVAALGFGFWLGLPRRYEQPLEEIDERLEEEGQHGRVKRHRTVFNLMQKKIEKGSRSRRRQARTPFRMR
ncbi:MAG: hypothetical protein WD013_04700 [Gemmatimonadota bacterium]